MHANDHPSTPLIHHSPTLQDQVAGDNPDRPDRKNVDQDLLYADIGIKLLNNFWGENNEGGVYVCTTRVCMRFNSTDNA